MKNLFIAEAPPFREPKYFYNSKSVVGSLRRGLFKQLGIDDFSEKGLRQFSTDSFLVDTIKCRLNKGEKGVPKEIIANCASRFLREEIEYIHPQNIFLLGDTARRGLAQLEGFDILNRCRIREECGKTLLINNYKVIIYAYPSTRNMPITKNHPLSELME